MTRSVDMLLVLVVGWLVHMMVERIHPMKEEWAGGYLGDCEARRVGAPHPTLPSSPSRKDSPSRSPRTAWRR